MQAVVNMLYWLIIVLIVGFVACWRVLRRIEESLRQQVSKIAYSADTISENVADISSAVGNIEHDLRPKDFHNTHDYEG